MFLDRIVLTKQQEVARLKAGFSLDAAERSIRALPACRGFAEALNTRRKRKIGLIAEVKKASPSKGLIREHFEPVSIAKAYKTAGADCLSVLTDVDYFQGSNDYLMRVKAEVNLPVLRKDFTIDYRQIYEARMIGADAVLLIAAILTDEQLREFAQITAELGMDALVEVHDNEELERVLALDATFALIGINNRNLRTFVTDLNTTERLIKTIPSDVTIISESGISAAQEIDWLQSIGADAVLIGEHFMRQPSIEQAVLQLMGPLAAEGVKPDDR